MKSLLIYNLAPHYRIGILRKIDESLRCDYVFGQSSKNDIRSLDFSFLHGRVSYVKNKTIVGAWYWQSGVQKLLRCDYDAYLISGETHCLSTWLFCLRAYLFHRKKKIFFWTHGWYGKETWIDKIAKKLFYRLANGGIFLYGEYARQLMIDEGFDSDRLYVIHNSLDYDKQLTIRKELSMVDNDVYQHHFKNNKQNVIFIGRLTKIKKLDMLLRALSSDDSYNLTFIGDGEEKLALQQLSADLGLEHSVWFYGACYDERQIGEMIYNADLCVSPGNVGLTAMHAMVYGTPVITHNNLAHQMPEFEAIHQNVTGDFFEYGNVDSLAKTIGHWLASKASEREQVRQSCYGEIDTQWTPDFQINVLLKHMRP